MCFHASCGTHAQGGFFTSLRYVQNDTAVAPVVCLAVEVSEMMILANILQQCREILAEHYGPQFRGLVLYGSVARGQEDAVSDIDLLVLLDQPFDYLAELRCIVDLLYAVQLESDRLISAKPAPFDEYSHGSIQLYPNARREGVPV